MAMIQIYYAPPSIYGRKVLTVLEEKGLPYTIVPVSIRAGEHLKDEYLRINPNGEIPSLVDDGAVIYESTAIVEYLDEKYPDPPLMPRDPASRARVRMIDDFCDLHLFPPIRRSARRRILENLPPAEDDVKLTAEKLARITVYLGKQDYLVGSFSLADCAFMPAIPSLVALGMGELITQAGLSGYAQRLMARKGYAGAKKITL